MPRQLFDPPAGPSRDIALMLPGRAYPPSAPLLFFTTQALIQCGWSVEQVWWDASTCGADPAAWVEEQVREALEQVAPRTDRVLVVGKSLGTLVASLTAPFAAAAVWLTPLLQSTPCLAGIRAAAERGSPQLLVGGSADPSWQPEAVNGLNVQLCEVEGADHGMCVEGDAVAAARAHVLVTESVLTLLSAIA